MPTLSIRPRRKFKHVAFANEKLDAIGQAQWFTCVGKGDLEGVTRAANWDEALAHADYSEQFDFGDYIQDLSNATTMYATSIDRDRYNKTWGKSHDLVHKTLGKFLNSEVFKRVPVKSLSNWVSTGITGTLANQVILALVYGVTFEPLENHVDYFLRGYFPCGYSGDYPDGTLIVY